jgi:putative selenate reductase molybdopterin-binding subunit
VIADGVISTGKPGAPRLTLAEAAKLRLHTPGGTPVLGVGVFGADTVSPDPKTKYGNYSLAYSFAAQIAEVEVDIQTGRTRVLRVYAAHDLGKAIYPPGAEGQVEGGVLQGVGFALYERYVVDRGQVINPNLGDYTLPSFRDAPRVETMFVETDDPRGPYGAKGVAETAIEPTAGAVANAVAHATGVRFHSIPLTAEKIFLGMHSRKAASQP